MAETVTRPQVRDSWLVPFLDLLLILVIVLLPLVNPPTKDGETKSPGTISIEIRWPDDAKCDVDLWAQAPGDSPVGFANARGNVLSLLRDDLGNGQDLSALNYENIYSRGSPDGEYIANVHLYRAGDCTLPVRVEYIITRRGNKTQSLIAKGFASLKGIGDETTLARWTMKDDKLVQGSVHHLPLAIRVSH